MWKRIKSMSFRAWMITLVSTVALVAVGFLGYTYFGGGKDTNKSDNMFSMHDKWEQDNKVDLSDENLQEVAKKIKEDKPYLEEKMKGLKGKNGDAIGYIYIPGTQLDEPVVQGKDNETYLNKTFEGGNVPFLGTVFMDTDNTKDFSDKLTWMFGHARGSKVGDHRMFNDVNYYSSQEYMDKHKYVVVETEGRKLYYEVAFMTIVPEDTSFYRINFADNDDFKKQLETLRADAKTVNSNVSINGEDKYMVLSTCREEDETIRANLYCRLIPDKELMKVVNEQGKALDYVKTR